MRLEYASHGIVVNAVQAGLASENPKQSVYLGNTHYYNNINLIKK